MTTITRSTPGVLRSLPLSVPLFLLFVTALLIPLTPGVDSVYRVVAPQFTVLKPPCAKDGDTIKCVIPVGDRVLTVSVKPGLPNLNSGCEATFAGERVSCSRDFGVTDASTPAVRVAGFALSEEEAAAVRDVQPWWTGADERSVTTFLFWALAGLCLAAAVGTWLLSATPREADPRRALMTSAMAVAVVVQPVASSFMLVPFDQALQRMGFLLLPPLSLAPILLMVLWQMLVGREITGKVGQRISLSSTALAVTAVYGFSVLLWSAFATGLVD
ncbi:hypothetical protein ABZ816_18775 [Actinosynnema sp. NPDC047251]|uniref:Uncharacterized protein n=1 Tax=Saccharothrix espanaensis (strain ATCC 51144 / DSM 44229 / JCM 9112 / NBRC 15066 / NRRL 15764) TaxID=1179773 RepID=K0K4S2_SACES|nr:hypothetical protein [Saccharothrix espanaensis]CCH33296.1 hypothetical protein BN6_60410 [Saccharothrix espanaensis DSM 44229]